jgi:thymidylate synthase (FAD)
MKIKCLDHGSVELMNATVDGDLLVVNAARCSFDKEQEAFDECKDNQLIKYLAKHDHVLPFRHPVCTLRILAPIFVLRQLGKHQVGFSWSEISRRYITTSPQFHSPEEWRKSADNVKQGSSEEILDPDIYAKDDYDTTCNLAHTTYEELLDAGVCPEQARMVLPQSMFTTTVTTGSLLGWFHMYRLRTEGHTQKETQEYAKAIGEVMVDLFPISWEALCEHSL